jgi:CAAX protease family protein
MEADPTLNAGILPSPGHVLAQPLGRTPRRLRAVFEVLICSGLPTQFITTLLLWLVSGGQLAGSRLTLTFLVLHVTIDTVAIVGLVWFFLRAGGERPAATLFGQGHVLRESWLGLSLMPFVFAIVATSGLAIARFAPWLRQDENPFAALVGSPLDAAILAAVGVVGGGVREEVQRAFILHRFEQHLGGAHVGLVFFSVLFGLLHALQGWAAAIITGLLGAFWALIYLWRRSIVAPGVSHAMFNIVETVVFLRL